MIDIASQAPDYSRCLTTEHLKAHLWLHVLQSDGRLPDLTVARVHQLRTLIRSWSGSASTRDLASLLDHANPGVGKRFAVAGAKIGKGNRASDA